nr:DUF262 domain-containing protein [Streptomyces sp. CMB-StM0423]
MHAQETTFKNLVQGEKQFQVPLYQRTYSWEREQLQQLWGDVVELVEEQAEGRSPAAHFLGSVVLAPGRVTAGGMQRWLVVDGQQRLTTLMLAFSALRDRHRARGAEQKADRIHDLVLVNKYHSGDDHYRLLPTQADRDAFTACIETSPKAGGSGNVGAAYRFFLSVLTEGEEIGGEAWTDTVESVLSGLLSIVEITAAEGDNVYRIFESINNTGVGLSQSDLLRNFLFMCLPNRGEQVYRTHWLPMQELLGPANLELLVWLDLVVAGNNRAKQSEIYRDQKRRLEAISTDEAALEGGRDRGSRAACRTPCAHPAAGAGVGPRPPGSPGADVPLGRPDALSVGADAPRSGGCRPSHGPPGSPSACLCRELHGATAADRVLHHG